MYFDRVSNALGHGVGTVLISLTREYCHFTVRLDFNCTKNVAEHEAWVMGLQTAIERKIRTLEVFGDSALVIYQLREEWETNDAKLVLYREFITELIKQFDKIDFNHLP